MKHWANRKIGLKAALQKAKKACNFYGLKKNKKELLIKKNKIPLLY